MIKLYKWLGLKYVYCMCMGDVNTNILGLYIPKINILQIFLNI